MARQATKRSSSTRKGASGKGASRTGTARTTTSRTKASGKSASSRSATGRQPGSRQSSSARASGQRGRRANALSLLKEDHRAVEEMFAAFEGARGARSRKAKLAAQICEALTAHATVEEEIFYPAAREQVEHDLLNEAQVEHASAKQLIAQIQGMDPQDELFDATVKVLGEYVKHHVREEERELFPEVRKADLDLAALGEQIAQRKQALGA